MKNKRLIFGVIATVALMTVVATGLTLALLRDNVDPLVNKFELGNVTTEIDESGEGSVKLSRIQNTGENDCYIRAQVTISPAEAAEAIELTFENAEHPEWDCSGWDWSQWENGDGYVYYTKPVPAGADSYTTYLFSGVKLKAGTDWKSLGIETFDVTVYQEAVQAEMFYENGTSTTDMKAIWNAYDPGSFTE